MIGAIIGDLAGSIYEYDQTKNIKPIKTDSLIDEKSFISDDTILTISVADAIINNISFDIKLKEYASKYIDKMPDFKPYFKSIFSPNFTKWASGKTDGKSSGNGALMRISPVGYLFNTESDVINNARLATIPSHNSEEAVNNATKVALIIFYARQGLHKEEIKNKLNLEISKPKPLTHFNTTCQETFDLCVYSLFNSNSFEESLNKVLSFGGDTDTNACIVGVMAEALYGVPQHLKSIALTKIPQDLLKILNQSYQRVNKIKKDIQQL